MTNLTAIVLGSIPPFICGFLVYGVLPTSKAWHDAMLRDKGGSKSAFGKRLKTGDGMGVALVLDVLSNLLISYLLNFLVVQYIPKNLDYLNVFWHGMRATLIGLIPVSIGALTWEERPFVVPFNKLLHVCVGFGLGAVVQVFVSRFA